jgi:uncharacterized protein (TIGR03000 family)
MSNYAGTSAQVTIIAPHGAEVWVDGTSIGSMASARAFRTPPLDPARRYRYTVRATWIGMDGQPVSQTKDVVFAAGTGLNVSFQ